MINYNFSKEDSTETAELKKKELLKSKELYEKVMETYPEYVEKSKEYKLKPLSEKAYFKQAVDGYVYKTAKPIRTVSKILAAGAGAAAGVGLLTHGAMLAAAIAAPIVAIGAAPILAGAGGAALAAVGAHKLVDKMKKKKVEKETKAYLKYLSQKEKDLAKKNSTAVAFSTLVYNSINKNNDPLFEAWAKGYGINVPTCFSERIAVGEPCDLALISGLGLFDFAETSALDKMNNTRMISTLGGAVVGGTIGKINALRKYKAKVEKAIAEGRPIPPKPPILKGVIKGSLIGGVTGNIAGKFIAPKTSIEKGEKKILNEQLRAKKETLERATEDRAKEEAIQRIIKGENSAKDMYRYGDEARNRKITLDNEAKAKRQTEVQKLHDRKQKALMKKNTKRTPLDLTNDNAFENLVAFSKYFR